VAFGGARLVREEGPLTSSRKMAVPLAEEKSANGGGALERSWRGESGGIEVLCHILWQKGKEVAKLGEDKEGKWGRGGRRREGNFLHLTIKQQILRGGPVEKNTS